MKIDRLVLKEALETVFPALVQKTLGRDQTFVFSGRYIAAFNGAIGIACPFKTDFQAELPAEELYKLISLSDLPEIEMCLGRDTLKISGEGLFAELSILKEQTDLQFLSGIKQAQQNMAALPKNMVDALSLCLFSVSTQNGFSALRCISVDGGYVWSTDSYRISRCKVGKFPSVLIPAIAAENILKHSIAHYYLTNDKGRIYFLSDDIILCSQLVLGQYPPCDMYFKKFDGAQIEIPKKVASALDEVSIFASNEESEKKIDRQITIEILRDKWLLKAKNDYGWIRKEIACKSPVSISFSVNPAFFKQAIEKSLLLFYAPGKVLFRSNDFEHILSLTEGSKKAGR